MVSEALTVAVCYPLEGSSQLSLSSQSLDVLAALGPYGWRDAVGIQRFDYIPADCLLLVVQKGVSFGLER